MILSMTGYGKAQACCQNETYINGIIKQVYDAYQRRLKENNQVDFDDLLLLTEQIFTEFPDVLEYFQNKYKYILVDEFQDTNVIQYNIVKMLANKYRNIFVVGDDDQSIYSFRGANVHNMYQFSEDYPERFLVKLTENYRSTNAILRGSNNLIKHNKHREEKELFSSIEGKLQDVVLHDAYYYEDEPRYIAEEIKNRGYNKILVVTDRALIDAEVAQMVTEVLDKEEIQYFVFEPLLIYFLQKVFVQIQLFFPEYELFHFLDLIF